MKTSDIMSALRMQAWERAKGELAAVQAASSTCEERVERWGKMQQTIQEFVKKVENEALVE